MSGRSIALCYGTRPQVIKGSRLAAALASSHEVITVDTGQHYDYELNALLYQQLEIPSPAVLLDVGSGDHATQTSTILCRAAALFRERLPQVVVVIGDTNSTLGCALSAAQLAIPVVHVEAGLRSGNLAMAEEINRRIVDSISTVLCAPSERAANQLREENVPGAVVNTGDVARDVMEAQLNRIIDVRAGGVPPTGEPFAFATLHRAELTADTARFSRTLESLAEIGMPVVLPMHPRTRAIVDRAGMERAIPPNVRVSRPFGYFETLASIREAAVVVTDSGGVQREAYWMGTPCVTVRTETEWTETIDCGANRLFARDDRTTSLADVVRAAVQANRGWDRNAYGDGHAADAIAAAVELALDVPRNVERAVGA